jgi:hypothetical protein
VRAIPRTVARLAERWLISQLVPIPSGTSGGDVLLTAEVIKRRNRFGNAA